MVMLELVTIMAAALALLAGFCVWRLASGPLDVTFARSFFEEALKNPRHGTYGHVAQAYLQWPDLAGPLFLGVKKLEIYNAGGHKILSMDDAALALSKADLLAGRAVPVGLVLNKPEINIVRDQAGKIDIGLGTQEMGPVQKPAKDDADAEALTKRILKLMARPNTPGGEAALAAISVFEIKDAKIIFSDIGAARSWQLPAIDLSFESTAQGLSAKFNKNFAVTTPEAEKITRPTFHSDILIPWDTGQVEIEAVADKMDIAALSVGRNQEEDSKTRQDINLDAHITARLDENLRPLAFQMSAHSEKGNIVWPAAYPDRVLPYKDFDLAASYTDETKTLALTKAQVTVLDVPFKAEAKITQNDAGWGGPVSLSIETLSEAQIAALWPAFVHEDKAKEWITRKITNAAYSDIHAAMDFYARPAQQGWQTGFEHAKAGFSFETMDVDYRPPMLPVTQAKGGGVFDAEKDHLSLKLTDGRIDQLRIASGDLAFDNLSVKGGGEASINVRLQGPLKSALLYLEQEPINLKKKFDPQKLAGAIQADVRVSFPTVEHLPVEDVKVAVDATLNDALLPGVFKNAALSGGPFALSVKDNAVLFKGNGRLNGQSAALEYKTFLHSADQAYKEKISARITADKALRETLGADLSDFIEDPVPVDMDYTLLTDGRAEAKLAIDTTPAEVFLKPFGYAKKRGEKGAAALTLKLDHDVLRSIDGLRVEGPDLLLDQMKLTLAQAKDGPHVTGADIGVFKVGQTDARFAMTIDGPQARTVSVTGRVFDLSALNKKKSAPEDKKSKTATRFSVKANKIYVDPGHALDNGTLNVETDQDGHFKRFEFTAGSKNTRVDVSYKPGKDGVRRFTMNAADAGLALRSFGTYDNIVGGTLEIAANPVNGANDNSLRGRIVLKNFKVVKAPTLTRLLSALSLPGLLGLLNNDGMHFSRLEADYDWTYRPDGSLITVKNGRTSGNAAGFTFGGTYDLAAKNIAIGGTIVPLSEVNTMLAKIPLVGNILSGGSGSIFAATYKVTGNPDKPDVFVNPLSVFTPGILREVLFQ